ncbi:MAG: hypothetical protein LBS53_05770, partial [Synergistaceae bacterium]|nr:hypothetical protein [Synergistaceae bacterium]
TATDNLDGDAGAAGIGTAYGDVEISGSAKVTAKGISDDDQSAGIITLEEGTSPGGDIKISGNAVVSATGEGAEGYGIKVEGTGKKLELAGSAEVTATADGKGYAVATDEPDGITAVGNAELTVVADGGKYYQAAGNSANNDLPSGTVTQPKTPLAGSGGGCDTGAGAFGALMALACLAVTRKNAAGR